jgi:RNA polymerase sigma-70 factor, ECF subfamily
MSATAAGSLLRNGEDFARLTGPFRPELLAHCYRMLGSVQDAEDLVQETLLRAWRSRDGFEGRASVRTWLYRIATNACLRAIENRARRPLPSGLGAPSDDPGAPLGPALDIPWLQPFPDAACDTGTRAGLRLALVAAMQVLPPRQRAVLILRDVLGWHAAEVADLLQISTVAVNSALQRARAALREAGLAEGDVREPAAHDKRAIVDKYAAAFENADIAALTRLLHDDAEIEMPPIPTWFAGREQVVAFLAARVLRRPGDFRMFPTAANGQPAVACYLRDHDGVHRAHAIAVLTVAGSRISRIVSFNDPALLTVFGMPQVAPAA